MADQKISELTAITGANTADDDELVIVDTSASQTKKITLGELENALAERDFSFGDNDKLTFGAGSDLQIYHDGSHSYIQDSGTGNLLIKSDGSGTYIRNASDQNIISAQGDEARMHYAGPVKLKTTSTGVDVTGDLSINDGTPAYLLKVSGTEKGYVRSNSGVTEINGVSGSAIRHNGFMKLNTTSTGIDVTGTVTADGLTVDGDARINDTIPQLQLMESDTTDLNSVIKTTAGQFRVQTINDAANSTTNRFIIDHGTGDISFYDSAGSSQSFFWDASAESLGIGTSSPSEKLHVQGDGADILLTDAGGGQTAKLGATGSNNGIMELNNSSHTSTVVLNTSGDSYLNGGNVGIGTSSPAQKLHVSSSSAIVGLLESTGSSAARLYFDNTGMTTAGDTQVWAQNNDLAFNTSGSEAMRIDSSGNVGIGTSSPSQALHVNSGGANYVAKFESSDSLALILAADNATTNTVAFGASGNNAVVLTNNVERMRIDSSGNTTFKANNSSVGPIVTLENTAAAVNGQVWGSIHFKSNDTSTNASGTRASIVGTSTSFNGDGNLVFSTAPSNGSNTEAMRIDSSGNLLVGTTDTQPASNNVSGVSIQGPYGTVSASRYNYYSLDLNRQSTDGDIAVFRKDGAEVGSIGGATGLLGIGNGTGNLGFYDAQVNPMSTTSGGASDGVISLGVSGRRFKDLYLSGGIKIVSPDTTSAAAITFGDSADAATGSIGYFNSDDSLRFSGYNNSEAMRIDSSGNLLVGTTSFTGTSGVSLSATGYVYASSTNDVAIYANRETSDGDIAVFRKDGSTVGSIAAKDGDIAIGAGGVGIRFGQNNSDQITPHSMSTNGGKDNALSLGSSGARFKDLYLSGGVYLGGTGSANKLDDYETGYHQTTIQMGSGSATATSTNDLLYYTIIGNMCFITGNIGINSVSSPSGTFSFTVPFAVDTGLSETSERAAGTVHLNGFSSENGSGIGFIENGSAVYVKTYARNNPVPTGACEMHINIFYPIA